MTMSKLSKLLQVTNEEKLGILKHYDMTETEFEGKVDILKQWINQCEHLPKEEEDNKIRIALINAKMSLEKTKQSLEGYYRVRTKYSNEFFDKLVPHTKEYKEGKKFATTVIMPKLTPDLSRITIFKMDDPNGEANDAFTYEIPVFMMAEMRIMKDLCLSNIIIIDFDGYGWKNLVKFTPSINQKLVDILMSVNLRIHSVHFINMSSMVDHVMRLIKNLLPGKIINKIHIHKTYESLAEHIPRECLPSSYGGTEKSLEELYAEWCEHMEESEDLFRKLLSIKSTAKIEVDPTQQDLFGCGAEGSFRQLSLD